MPVILFLIAIAAGGYYVVKQQNKTNTAGEGLTEQMQKSAQLRSGSGIYKGSMINQEVLDYQNQNAAAGSTSVASTSTGTNTTKLATYVPPPPPPSLFSVIPQSKSPFQNGIQ